MPAVNVRRSDAVFPAVHASDEDWEAVVASWLPQYGIPEEQQTQLLAEMRTNVEQQKFKPWLIASFEGIGAIKPNDFAAAYEDVAATTVLDDIYTERMRQVAKGYDAAHDDLHGIHHLLEIAGSYQITVGADPTAESARDNLIKAAATLNAAIDLLGRAEARTTALGEPSA